MNSFLIMQISVPLPSSSSRSRANKKPNREKQEILMVIGIEPISSQVHLSSPASTRPDPDGIHQKPGQKNLTSL
jgi:hypothetical protein